MYKTIVLQMLENRPLLHRQLRRTHAMLATVEQLAQEFKAAHQQWIDRLAEKRPDSELSLLASQAMELALKDLEDRLPSESPPDEESLDDTMAFLRLHTPPVP